MESGPIVLVTCGWDISESPSHEGIKALSCFSWQLLCFILVSSSYCVSSQDSPSHPSGGADKAALSLHGSASQDSVSLSGFHVQGRCLFWGFTSSQNFPLLMFWWHHICVRGLVTFMDQGLLDSHCVQSWTSLENWSRFLYICIFGADLSLTINSILNIAGSFRALGIQVSADPAVCLASVYSKCLSTAQKADSLTLSGMLSAWRAAASSSCCLIIICYLLPLLQNRCKISSSNWAGSRPCLHYAEAEP